MIRKIGRTLLLFALCGAIAAPSLALQSVAWAAMLFEYSQHASFATAAAQTFYGEHPCHLCRKITGWEHSKKQDAPATATMADLFCARYALRIFAPQPPAHFLPAARLNPSAQAHPPPVPPPRSELA